MTTDPLAAASDAIRALVKRKANPLTWLAATFTVIEAMDDATARAVLGRLMAQRFLAIYDADMAQLLAQRLGVEVQWSHATFMGDGEWIEGRGS